MQKYMKKDTEVEAIQYNGTQESYDEIKNSIEPELRHKFVSEKGNENTRGELIFSVICKTKIETIYPTEWIVKDGKYYFVISDNVFKDMFTEMG